MGLFVGALILIGTVGAWWGTRNTPMTRRRDRPAAACADQLRVVAASRDVPHPAHHVRAAGARHRGMLAGVDYVARVLLGSAGASTILFVCFVAPALLADPALAAGRRAARQAARLPLGLAAPRRRRAGHACSPCGSASPPPRPASRVVGRRLRRPARCSRSRCCPTSPPPTPPAPARTAPASTPGSGPPGETLGLALGPAAVRRGARPRRLRLVDRRRRRPARLGAHRDRAGLLDRPGRADRGLACWSLRRYRLDQEVPR